MAYCVKCGVKLGDSEKRCPLCQTVVYHPDIPTEVSVIAPFPKEHEEKIKKLNIRFKLLIVTMIILLPTILTMICDYSLNSEIVWSGIVVSAICLAYCLIFIPLIFSKKDVFLYLAIDFLALLMFQWYLAYTTEGTWFAGFALPVVCSAGLIVIAAICIKRFTRASYLLISSIIFILTGLDCVFIEFLISNKFMDKVHFVWSYYPLVTFLIVGIILFLCDKNHRLKEKISKKFFI